MESTNVIILRSKYFIFLLRQLDIELTVVMSAKNRNYKGFCFLFEFVWLKSMVTKQKLKTICGQIFNYAI